VEELCARRMKSYAQKQPSGRRAGCAQDGRPLRACQLGLFLAASRTESEVSAGSRCTPHCAAMPRSLSSSKRQAHSSGLRPKRCCLRAKTHNQGSEPGPAVGKAATPP